MKLLFCLVSILLSTSLQAQNFYHDLPFIKARSSSADFRVGNHLVKGSWTISPEIKSDSLLINCYHNNEEFVFYTDLDSISFNLHPGESHAFYVLLNDSDYALTVVSAVKPVVLNFDTISQNSRFTFWYQQELNSYLEELKSSYPLDSIVKDAATDTEKAIKILSWVNKRWKHNGDNEPEKNDALSILKEAEQGKNFRCVEYGIVATACLNAIGLKARTLGLMTANVQTTKYGAGHVLLEVYLEDLKKWALLDGQWDAIPMLNKIPLNAVEFQRAIAESYDQLEIHSGNEISKRQYVDWISPYLYYFTIPFDNREGVKEVKKIDGKKSLMLVPMKAPNPAVFQIVHKIDYCIYTNSVKDFYSPPLK